MSGRMVRERQNIYSSLPSWMFWIVAAFAGFAVALALTEIFHPESCVSDSRSHYRRIFSLSSYLKLTSVVVRDQTATVSEEAALEFMSRPYGSKRVVAKQRPLDRIEYYLRARYPCKIKAPD